MTAPDNDGRKSIGELLSDVSQDVTVLLRQEVALAKAEVRQSVTNAGKGAGMFAGAGLAGHFVLLFLSIALWWGLGNHFGYAKAALVVALIWAIIGAVLGVMGRKELKSVGGIPKTTESLKKIPGAAAGHENAAGPGYAGNHAGNENHYSPNQGAANFGSSDTTGR